MIIGIGTDIVDIRRIEKAYGRHKERFLTKNFTAAEIKEIKAHQAPAEAMAKRFAAKEAYAKARGTGFRAGFTLKDIAITHDALGKPSFALSAKEKKHMKGATAHLSLSDEPPYALAFVVFER
jgi:holo-[acyl-carrier protein] synthase